MDTEIWKKVKGFDGYEVSNLSRVRSSKGNVSRILKQSLAGKGYCKIILRQNNKGKNVFVHRLVCEYFKDNYSKKCVVNHIDGDKLNNSLDNLECCTQKENIHSYFRSIHNENVCKICKNYKKHIKMHK